MEPRKGNCLCLFCLLILASLLARPQVINVNHAIDRPQDQSIRSVSLRSVAPPCVSRRTAPRKAVLGRKSSACRTSAVRTFSIPLPPPLISLILRPDQESSSRRCPIADGMSECSISTLFLLQYAMRSDAQSGPSSRRSASSDWGSVVPAWARHSEPNQANSISAAAASMIG